MVTACAVVVVVPRGPCWSAGRPPANAREDASACIEVDSRLPGGFWGRGRDGEKRAEGGEGSAALVSWCNHFLRASLGGRRAILSGSVSMVGSRDKEYLACVCVCVWPRWPRVRQSFWPRCHRRHCRRPSPRPPPALAASNGRAPSFSSSRSISPQHTQHRTHSRRVRLLLLCTLGLGDAARESCLRRRIRFSKDGFILSRAPLSANALSPRASVDASQLRRPPAPCSRRHRQEPHLLRSLARRIRGRRASLPVVLPSPFGPRSRQRRAQAPPHRRPRPQHGPLRSPQVARRRARRQQHGHQGLGGE